VIATGEQHSIKEFLQLAFDSVGITDWQQYVESDPKFKRPAELYRLCGDATKAEKILGWQRKTDFKTLVSMMVAADIKRLQK
jgi:GDPmannose 4,6-dehydratase